MISHCISTCLNASSVRIFARMLLLMCCAVMLNGATAQADTCGHYLFKNGVPVSTVTAPKVTLPLQMTPDHSAPLMPVAPPCHGPGCKNQSTPLAPPAAPSLRLTQSDPAVLLQGLLVSLDRSRSFPLPHSEFAVTVLNAEIFRPPAA